MGTAGCTRDGSHEGWALWQHRQLACSGGGPVALRATGGEPSGALRAAGGGASAQDGRREGGEGTLACMEKVSVWITSPVRQKWRQVPPTTPVVMPATRCSRMLAPARPLPHTRSSATRRQWASTILVKRLAAVLPAAGAEGPGGAGRGVGRFWRGLQQGEPRNVGAVAGWTGASQRPVRAGQGQRWGCTGATLLAIGTPVGGW